MSGIRTVVIKKFDEKLKQHIVREVESGKMSQMEAARECGVGRTAICKWLKMYGKLRVRTKIVEVVMKEEKAKIKELQAALGDAHLKLRFYETLMDLAKEKYGIDIKKNLATKASEGSESKGSKSKSSAK